MRHSTALDLLEQHGATFLPKVGNEPYRASLNGYVLHWRRDSWSKNIRDLEIHHTDGRSLWHLFEGRMANGSKVKQFIEHAKEQRVRVCGIELATGPDAQNKLKDTLRVHHLTCAKPSLRIRDDAPRGMFQNVLRGDMPPEVYIDWLKDQGILAD